MDGHVNSGFEVGGLLYSWESGNDQEEDHKERKRSKEGLWCVWLKCLRTQPSFSKWHSKTRGCLPRAARSNRFSCKRLVLFFNFIWQQLTTQYWSWCRSYIKMTALVQDAQMISSGHCTFLSLCWRCSLKEVMVLSPVSIPITQIQMVVLCV